jgi:hypothetical protein
MVNTPLSLYLITSIGSVDIAINPGDPGDKNITDWKWFHEHTLGEDQIDLFPKDIGDAKILYIACWAFTSSTFAVFPYTSSETEFVIYDGMTLYG